MLILRWFTGSYKDYISFPSYLQNLTNKFRALFEVIQGQKWIHSFVKMVYILSHKLLLNYREAALTCIYIVTSYDKLKLLQNNE